MQNTLFFFLLFSVQTAFSQFHLGAFVGGSSYLGEVNNKPLTRYKPALGLSVNYELTDRIMLRGGYTFGKLEAADKYSQADFVKQTRNLSFQSKLSEFSLIGELTIFNLYNINWSPYAFAGLAVYRFNPYVVDSGQKVYLQPLSTEGQGLPGSSLDPYKLTQFAIPFGGGIKLNVSDNIRLGFEMGIRRLFTDYLDDVSGFYPDAGELLNAKGPKAVQLSYRGDEAPGERPGYPDVGFPVKGVERGGPSKKDWYYFTGIHLTFRLGGGYGSTFASGGKRQYGCPVVPM